VRSFVSACVAFAILVVAVPDLAGAEVAGVATLPEPSAHWVWVPDRLLQHSLLFDGDSGVALGALDSPSLLTPKTPLLSRSRNEMYSADIAYSRGLRGERIDFVSIYDATTMDFKAEVVVPTRAGSSNTSQQYAELLGERFLAIFNQFPNTSVSIVDLDQRLFVGEIAITGCAGIYPLGERQFASLCGNGTTLQVDLTEHGRFARYRTSEPFFDVVTDPLAMPSGREAARWHFVSFEGMVHSIDYSGELPVALEPWSLLDESERARGWRPGGFQHVAVHAPTGRLFVVMHEDGSPGSHKKPGTEVWVLDLEKRERIARFEMPNLTAAFLGSITGIDAESFTQSVLDWLLPSGGVQTIAVSQDDSPLLFVRSSEIGAVGVLDAMSGETLRILNEAGLAGPTLRVP